MEVAGDARWLSAKFKEDFAYPTVKDRIPVILTKVIDQACRMKVEVAEKYGDAGLDDLKLIAGRLSKLKNEIQTDKPVIPIEDNWRDTNMWNDFLKELTAAQDGVEPSWFKNAWLYVECYFYRRIQETFHLCKVMKEFDTFGSQKQQAYKSSEMALSSLGEYLQEKLTYSDPGNKEDLHSDFDLLMQVALWGNKCDLSISAGADNHQQLDPFVSLNSLKNFILLNHTDQAWITLHDARAASQGTVTVAIVLDNAGFEFFTDLCLAEFLLRHKLADKIRFYPKAFPWFVSDVTLKDVTWTLDELTSSTNIAMSELGKQWKQRIADGSFQFIEHDFWTLPYDFSHMKKIAPDLYTELGLADLILLKGDLNYRKLTRDRKWQPTVAYEKALAGFHPAPHCALRTLKADVVTGLKQGQAEEALRKDDKWMTSGDFAVIQFSGFRVQ